MQRKVRRFLVINWLALSIGFVLTAIAIKHMYPIRGGAAIGSELFITPVLVFLNKAYRLVSRAMRMEG